MLLAPDMKDICDHVDDLKDERPRLAAVVNSFLCHNRLLKQYPALARNLSNLLNLLTHDFKINSSLELIAYTSNLKKKIFLNLRDICTQTLDTTTARCDQYRFLIMNKDSDYQKGITELFDAEMSRSRYVFLGPRQQDKILRFVHSTLCVWPSGFSRRALIKYVCSIVFCESEKLSCASCAGVIRLLYNCECFDERPLFIRPPESVSSLSLTLKSRFKSYEAFRRQHDAGILELARDSRLRMPNDFWSIVLYGDTEHLEQIEDAMSKLRAKQLFSQLINETYQKISDDGLDGLCPEYDICRKNYVFMDSIDIDVRIRPIDDEDKRFGKMQKEIQWKTLDVCLVTTLIILEANFVFLSRLDGLINTTVDLNNS